MASPLTVRNLTATPILLVGVQRFEDPNTQQSKASAFSFTSRDTTSLAPHSAKLGEHVQTSERENLGVNLLPFEAYTLKILKPNPDRVDDGPLASTLLRITIEAPGGERYRIDTNPSYTQKASQLFTPLTPSPSTSYSALYHPASPVPHLTIHTNHQHGLSTWMSALPSTLPLSAFSIPGTHNSHTCYRALPSVRCQAVSVKDQLENGIRFLDIRVQPVHATDTSKKDLYLVHGAFPISLTGPKYLEPILKTCVEFLEKNPSETVLVSLKREGVGSSTDEHLSEILEKHYITPNKDRWYTSSSLPYLKDARGKLVLVRRYNVHEALRPTASTSGYGLDATAWPNNSTHARHGVFCVQDFCEVMDPSDIPKKLQYSNEHLVRAAARTAIIPAPLYLNFLTGSNFWNRACWPDKISKVVNRGIEEWICMGHHLQDPLITPQEPGRNSIGSGEASAVKKAKRGDGSTGVVIMDNVGESGDWDLVKLIIGMNIGVGMKGRVA